jgi:asparagine synthase (glutamine-hydrolysing)
VCGICGIVQITGSPRSVIETHILERMTDRMRHRGPDDRGTFEAPGVAFGVRRLSIVDVAGGHQPVSDESQRIWAIQNGELYNHERIRMSLVDRGHQLRSRCDTEILPHLYEEVGDRLPQELHGKFALAAWDCTRRRGLIARDRLGVKPLYYSVVDDLLVFASELKSLLASGLVDTTLDIEAIDVFLTLGYFPGPRTPLANVRKLLPGHRLVVDGGVQDEQYWAYPQPAPEPRLEAREAADRLLSVLEEAVRDRLMSDVPIGAMLSGGLDSSLIVALMARNMTAPVKTFSVGFAEAADTNELPYARQVASALGTEHHEVELSVHDELTPLEDLVWALDEPVADLSAIGFEAISSLASTEVTVALSGQGADELFGGYPRYVRAAVVERSRRVPRTLVRVGARSIAPIGDRWARFANALLAPDPAARYLALRAPCVNADIRRSLAREPIGTTHRSALEAVAAYTDGLADNPLDATQFLDAQLGLVDDMLHYFDRMSMTHSLEVRVPFLDHRLVEFAALLPGRLRVGPRLETKVVLRRAAVGLVPGFVLDRPKVGFFSSMVGNWLASQLDRHAPRYLLGADTRIAELVNSAVIREMVKSPSSHAEGLYALLVLEVWLSSFLPRALRPDAPRQGERPRASLASTREA